LVTRPVILAATVARRRGVTYPLALNMACRPPISAFEAAAVSTTGRWLRNLNAPKAAPAKTRMTRTIRPQRRLEPPDLRWLSEMRNEPKSCFGVLSGVAKRPLSFCD